ncbi:hypothetical protein ZWY2020_047108 [Hordeum vulgare]|nr:hypothetical protein ZWY2020_047108 [Hordeum vulgare]
MLMRRRRSWPVLRLLVAFLESATHCSPAGRRCRADDGGDHAVEAWTRHDGLKATDPDSFNNTVVEKQVIHLHNFIYLGGAHEVGGGGPSNPATGGAHEANDGRETTTAGRQGNVAGRRRHPRGGGGLRPEREARIRAVTAPEVEVQLFRRGRGLVAVFRSPLCGYTKDQLEVGDILEKHDLKSVFAFDAASRSQCHAFNPIAAPSSPTLPLHHLPRRRA